MKILALLAAAAAALSGAADNLPSESEPQVSAKSAIVIDALSGDVVFAKNPEERLPMASTTKIMTAFITLQQDDLDEEFTVDSEAIKVEGSSMGLCEGDKVTLRTLACGMLLPSGNDAANAAACRISGSVEAFVGLMNDYAAELGLENTHFVTPSGLDDYTEDHYSTAADMAKLARTAMQNEDFRDICGKKTVSVEFGDPPYKRWLTNTNRLLSMCEGAVGIKTGFTDKAGRCLVSACERGTGSLICVTLNDKNDWDDHMKLYDYSFSKLQEISLEPELPYYEIPVIGSVPLTCCGKSTKLSMLPGTAARLERVTIIKPFIYAPAEEVPQPGRTDFYLDGRLIASLPIVPEQENAA
ncbi:MAG: D-alanyl-D-alanine carboxypeptidase [Ruminococcus sp.]|nr:D-alanyl-D-alanine carboxypeptidase [Ruminococcus sp.]